MTRADIIKEIIERGLLEKYENVILVCGFEEAFLGVSVNKPSRVIYDLSLIHI